MRGEQTEIPGAERPKIPSLEKAAKIYRDHRDERMAAGREEKKAKDKLLTLMQEHDTHDPAGRCLCADG